MPQLEVYCTVKNCDYWGKGNHCLAEKIVIVADSQATQWPDSMDAQIGNQLQTAEVENCMQTACKTFSPRYSHAGPIQDMRDTQPSLAQQYPHQ
jgi:hypothetical protein